MSDTQAWELFKAIVVVEAQRRLDETDLMITTVVNNFWRDAHDQIEDLKGPSEQGLGLEIFKAFTSVIMVWNPVEAILEPMAAEAIKGFRDVIVAGVSEKEKATADLTYEDARSQLRHVLGGLAKGAVDSATAALKAGKSQIGPSLDAFFAANDDVKTLEYGANASANMAWICDRIGIRDPGNTGESEQLSSALWEKFNEAVARVSWDLKMEHESPLDRRSFEFETWLGLDLHGKIEMLAALDHTGRDDLLRGGLMFSPDEIASWMHAADIWTPPHDRQMAEMELMTMTLREY
jgi:hypothetical protein